MEDEKMEKNRTLTWADISKYRNELMAIGILSVVALHIFENLSSIKPSIVYKIYFGSVGSVGVDLFLFLSGFGVYYSLSRQPYSLAFYKKRLKRVLLPYLIIGFLYWVIKDFLVSHTNVGRFLYDWSLISFWTEGLRTFWYITIIIILYFISPFVFQLNMRAFVLLNCIVIAACVVVYFIDPTYFTKIEIAILRINVFLFGLWGGKLAKQGKRVSNKLLAILILSIPIKILAGLKEFSFARLFNAYYAVFLILFYVFLRKKILKQEKFFKAISLIGNYTLELYLTHVSLRSLIMPMNLGINALYKCLVWVVLSVPMTYIFSLINKHLSRGRKKHT